MQPLSRRSLFTSIAGKFRIASNAEDAPNSQTEAPNVVDETVAATISAISDETNEYSRRAFLGLKPVTDNINWQKLGAWTASAAVSAYIAFGVRAIIHSFSNVNFDEIWNMDLMKTRNVTAEDLSRIEAEKRLGLDEMLNTENPLNLLMFQLMISLFKSNVHLEAAGRRMSYAPGNRADRLRMVNTDPNPEIITTVEGDKEAFYKDVLLTRPCKEELLYRVLGGVFTNEVLIKNGIDKTRAEVLMGVVTSVVDAWEHAIDGESFNYAKFFDQMGNSGYWWFVARKTGLQYGLLCHLMHNSIQLAGSEVFGTLKFIPGEGAENDT